MFFDKPEVEVQVQSDDWVFIKIGFSTPQPSQPPQESFKEASWDEVKKYLGSSHIRQQLLFSMFPIILTFDFELVLGSF